MSANTQINTALNSIEFMMESRGFSVAMISPIGSHNYGLATKDSDVDIKAVYFPKWSEFYENSFTNTSNNKELLDIDYNIMPIQHYIRNGLFKGNVNFFEVLYSEHARLDPSIAVIRPLMKDYLADIFGTVVMSSYYTGMSYIKKYNKTIAVNPNSIDFKSAANAIRLFGYAQRIMVDSVDLDPNDYCHKNHAIEIRNGEKTKAEIDLLLRTYREAVEDVIFPNDIYDNSYMLSHNSKSSNNKKMILDYVEKLCYDRL